MTSIWCVKATDTTSNEPRQSATIASIPRAWFTSVREVWAWRSAPRKRGGGICKILGPRLAVGHHVQVLTFDREQLTYRVELLGGEVFDEHKLLVRPPKTATKTNDAR